MSDEQRSGLSRRDLIKRGAIIGGVAWSAPIVQGIASPAFAEGGSPPGGECTDYYQFKADWDKGLQKFVFDTDTSAALPNCVEPDKWGTVPDGSDKLTIHTVVLDDDGEPILVTVSDKPADPRCEVVILRTKGGAFDPNEPPEDQKGYCLDGAVSGDGSSATFTVPAGKAAISYIAGIICCE